MKRIVSFLSAAAVAVSFAVGELPFGGDGLFEAQSAMAATPAINKTEATIYGMSSDYDAELTISGDTSFQISVSGASKVTYSVQSGSRYASVSSTGLVEVNYTTWYWKNGVGTTAKPADMTGYTIEKDMYEGDAVIKVTADSTVFNVTVHVVNYAKKYADDAIDKYIAENITSDMTDYDKIKMAAKMAADFDYNYRYQSYIDMIIHKGGDCWASTNLIIAVCEKLGYNAWIRVANRDPGAGSGHRNALVEGKDGTLYLAEAGYSGSAPRLYNVTVRTSLFSTKYNSTYGGYEVYQYDGQTVPETLEVPDEIDGRKIVAVGDSFLTSKSGVKKVILPDAVKSIGKSAFNSVSDLEEINLPASLENISDFAFTNCQKLSTVTVPEGCNFVFENGMLLDKAKTTLYFIPNSDVSQLPDTITDIRLYSVYYNKNIKKAVVPEGVTSIGEGAFGNCDTLRYAKINGSPALDDFVFANCPKLKRVVIPETVTEIGDNLFYGSTKNAVIYTSKGSAADTYAQENSLTVKYFDELTAGDVNDDGSINMKDLTLLQQYLAEWGVDADDYNADVNDDDKITMTDLTRLQQYLADWDVTLK